MNKAARALTALLVSALVLLGGCAANNPQRAARVGGVTITDAQVDSVAQAVAAGIGGELTAGSQRLPALSVLIGNELARQVGAATGATVTPAERSTFLAGNPQLTQLATDPALTDVINALADAQVIAIKLGPDAFNTAAQGVRVEVNPRFGTWNATLAQLNGDSGSISKPAPAVTASA